MMTKYFYENAKINLPKDVFAFIDGGSHDELALKRNRNSFNRYSVIPRVLCGLDEVSTQTEIFGENLTAPVLIAPAAYQGLLSENGELDMLMAANHFNTIMVISMFSSTDYTTLAKNKNNSAWMQMYFLKDRKINEDFIQRIEELGFDAIVLTVDAPVYAKRNHEKATPLNFPTNMNFKHLEKLGISVKDSLKAGRHFSSLLSHSISWDDIDWLANKTSLPIIIKGIIAPKDTMISLSYPNVKGIIISNHGGRQLDSCIAPIEIIREHKSIIDNKDVKLFLDGGITCGADIFKSLAVGADATLIGRSALWALSSEGSGGVIKVLSALQEELREMMTLCGVSNIHEITPEFITNRREE